MLEMAKHILDVVAEKTDSIVLFHSLSGKDSIVMLDLCYPRFKKIVVVYLYVIPNLRHLNKYANYIKMKYPNVQLVQSKHYALYNYEAFGFMGAEKTEVQRQWRLRDIATMICSKTGIHWSAYGFKQTDSLQRRLMLKNYDMEAVEWNTQKVYPLSSYTNKEVLQYIKKNNLKTPENYGEKSRSIGTDITSPVYLNWLKENSPEDLERVLEIFPLCRTLM